MVNESDLVYLIPEEIANKVPLLINLLQAVGIFIIIYIIFSIVNMVINNKKAKEIKKINDNLDEIKVLLKKK